MKNKQQFRAIFMIVDQEEKPVVFTPCSAFYDEIEDLESYLELNKVNVHYLGLKLCEAFEVSSLNLRLGLEVNQKEVQNFNWN